ncbi:hypothetical protein ACOSQ2_032230 [Xanthoceras sorbifolium]
MLASGKCDKDFVYVNSLISWSPPPLDWVKLNVDGSRSGDLGYIKVGGVIWDSNCL